MRREDRGAVAVGDALDVRLQVLVCDDGHLGAEGGAVGGAGEAAAGEVLGPGIPGEDLGKDALLHSVDVGGHLFDEPQLLGVLVAASRSSRGRRAQRRRRGHVRHHRHPVQMDKNVIPDRQHHPEKKGKTNERQLGVDGTGAAEEELVG